MSQRALAVVLGALVVVVAGAVYSGGFNNDFIWDDPIVFDKQLPFFDSLSSVLFPPPNIPQYGEHYYRPVIVLTYLLDEWAAKTFWPQDQRVAARRITYHASPVLYHAAATVLVYLLGLTLLAVSGPLTRPRLGAAAAGALLFAVHPIHVESVAWMAGRSDVVCSLFFFGFVIAYVRWRRGGRAGWLAASLGLALGAMMSKETGVGLILLAPALDYLLSRTAAPEAAERPAARAERRRGTRRESTAPARGGPAWLGWLGLAAMAVAYFALRAQGIDSMGSPALRLVFAHFGRLPVALGWSVVKAFWPPPQSAFVAAMPTGIAYTGLGLAALVAAVVVVIRLRPGGRAFPELASVIVFFSGLAFSLAVAVFPISETPLAERYLYIPSAGFCLLLGLLSARLIAWAAPGWGAGLKTAAPVGLALLAALPAAWATARRVEIWSSSLPFWLDMVAKAPGYGIPHLHLGITYTELGRHEEAEAQYRKALATYDDAEGRSKAHNNLGSLLVRLDRYDEAIEHFRAALAEAPRYDTPHYNWGLALLNQGRESKDPNVRALKLSEALHHFQKALEINPRYPKAHLRYGELLARMGRIEEGRRHLQRVLDLAPASAEANDAHKLLARFGP